MATNHPIDITGLTYTTMQLAFSTAEQQQMLFDVVEGSGDIVIVAAPAGDEGVLQVAPPDADVVPRLAYLAGKLVDLDPGSPPGSRPLGPDAALLRLAQS